MAEVSGKFFDKRLMVLQKLNYAWKEGKEVDIVYLNKLDENQVSIISIVAADRFANAGEREKELDIISDNMYESSQNTDFREAYNDQDVIQMTNMLASSAVEMIPTVFKQSMLITPTIPTTVSQCIASSEKTANTHQEVSALLTGIRKSSKEGVILAPDPKKKCTMKMPSIVSCEHSTSTQSLASSSPTKTTASAHPVMSASLTGIDGSHEEAVPLVSDLMKE